MTGLRCIFLVLAVVGVEGELLDLTHDVTDKALHWPLVTGFKMNITIQGTRAPFNFWVQGEEYTSSTHVGTHMDAPLHFNKNSWSIADIPLERFVTPAVFIDIHHKAAVSPDTGITLEDVQAYEEEYGPIPRGACVFMCSVWSDRYINSALSLGNEDDDITDAHFPGFYLETVQWLFENRGIVGIATDAMSFDLGQDQRLSVHVYITANQIYGLENVKDTCKAPPSGTTAYILPSKLKGVGGAPVRVVVQWNTAENSAEVAVVSMYTVLANVIFSLVSTLLN